MEAVNINDFILLVTGVVGGNFLSPQEEDMGWWLVSFHCAQHNQLIRRFKKGTQRKKEGRTSSL